MESELEQQRLEEELAELAAHVNAATARWLELALEFRAQGGAAGDDFARWLAWRCGVSTREAREYVRVAEALRELPAIRAAFGRGELTLTKVRALTRAATPASEQRLLALAAALTASQLERALRAFRELSAEQAGASHELEYVDYFWDDDGTLVLRARLAAEEGTVLVRALEAARERVRERQRAKDGAEGMAAMDADGFVPAAPGVVPPRAPRVEALLELARASLAAEQTGAGGDPERARLVVHVDAAALTGDGPGRCDLDDGPVLSVETARRLGCDAETVTSVERNGLPVSVGRRRRTVPPALRRLLEARDDGCCRWPGCDRRRHLDAHHRTHWADGGETALDNLLLLCWHHHRLVHEGGYTIEATPTGELRFRNRHGVLCPTVPRSPPGSVERLIAHNRRAGLEITAKTNRNGDGDRLELGLAVEAIGRAFGHPHP